ncbi:MAG: hypothetical protein H6733_14590 [Alphaproteobacteria bacterium]|nr:hypothetical protein [Alphaproteobacteria bacterium]
MRVLGFVLGMAFAGGGVVALPEVAHAADVAAIETSATSLDAEADAVYAMVQVIKKEVREGRLDITDEAKLAFQHGVTAFRVVQQRGAIGDWKTAFIEASTARSEMTVGANEVFSVRTSEPIKLTVKAYLDILEPRAMAVRELVRERRDESLMSRWWQAKAAFEEAKKLAAVGSYGRSWATMVDAAGKFDHLMLEAVWDVPIVDGGVVTQ